MPRPTAQDLGLPPTHRRLELRAVKKRLEALLRIPLALDQVTPPRIDVFKQMRFDVPRNLLEMLQHPVEALLELLFLPGDHVVVHADRRHARHATREVPTRERSAHPCRPTASTSPSPPAAARPDRA